MGPIGPRERFQKSPKPPNLGWRIRHLKITVFWRENALDFDDFFDFFDYNCHFELIETLFGYHIGMET